MRRTNNDPHIEVAARLMIIGIVLMVAADVYMRWLA